MEALLGGIFGLIIVVIFLPQIITTLIMSSKGYSGCLWFFLSFFLSWFGVIIALCMPNIRRQEQRHKETIAALSAQKSKSINNSERSTSQFESVKGFRLDAIKNLKAMGNPFDEFDVELEMEKLKKEYDKHLKKKQEEQDTEQKRMQQEATRIAIVVVGGIILFFIISANVSVNSVLLAFVVFLGCLAVLRGEWLKNMMKKYGI